MIFKFRPDAGLQQGARLQPEQGRPLEGKADCPPAERRIVLARHMQVGERLVRADIEGAEHHRPVAGGGQNRLIELGLLVEAREPLRHHELQLGAEQADAVGPGVRQMRQVDDQSGIDAERDPLAVAASPRGDARSSAY